MTLVFVEHGHPCIILVLSLGTLNVMRLPLCSLYWLAPNCWIILKNELGSKRVSINIHLLNLLGSECVIISGKSLLVYQSFVSPLYTLAVIILAHATPD